MWAYYSIGNWIKSCGVGSGDDFEDNIDEGYRTELSDQIGARDLWDQGQDPKIESGNVDAPQHKVI
jgi:hypothetical protein